MATLLPEFRDRVPEKYLTDNGGAFDDASVPHCYNGNVPFYKVNGGIASIAAGADAGIPGAFTPAGAVIPGIHSDLAGVTANPATAWTTGQYVVLADGTHAYWGGTAWGVGEAA